VYHIATILLLGLMEITAARAETPKTSPITRTATARTLVIAACSDTTGLNIAPHLQNALAGLYKDTGNFKTSSTKDALTGFEADKVSAFLIKNGAELTSFVFLEKQRISILLFDKDQPGKFIASSEMVNADPKLKVNQADLENQFRVAFRRVIEHYDTQDFQSVQLTVNQQTKTENESKSGPSLLGGGLMLGFSYLFPSIFYQYTISGKWVVGATLGAMMVTGANEKSFNLNLMANVDYFPEQPFRKLWIRSALGLYRFSLTSSGQSETIYSPAILVTGGWRWTLANDINAGAAVGLQYLFTKKGNLFTLDLSGILPVATIDVAWTF
jgi:hypothetical protein